MGPDEFEDGNRCRLTREPSGRRRRHGGGMLGRLLMIALGPDGRRASPCAPIAYMLWPHGRRDRARRALAADHRRRRGVQRAAGRDPLQGAAPPGRAGAHRPELRVAFARRRPTPASSRRRPTRPTSPTGCSSTIAAQRQHAAAGRAAQGDLSALRSTPAPMVGADGLSLQSVPRRLALPGRGPDLRSGARRSASCSAAPAGSRSTPACACTSGGSAAPTSRCAFRATGWRLAQRSPTASTA